MKAFALIVIGLGALIAWVVLSKPSPQPAPVAPTAPAPTGPPARTPEMLRLEKACEKTLREAKRAGVLYNIAPGYSPARFLVTSDFAILPMPQKEGIAEAASCVIAGGDPSAFPEVELRDYLTGRLVARYSRAGLELE